MPVFSRLTAYAVAVGILFASAGAALAGLGQPSPWQIGLQDAASPVMDDIIWFHNFLLWIIAGDHRLRSRSAGDRDRAVQRARQSDPVAHHA